MDKMVLKTGWKLKQVDLTRLDEATWIKQCQTDAYDVKAMPMEVADVLIDLGVIEEPWKPGLCKQYLWIGQSDWIYSNTFRLPDLGGKWRFNCDGLDLFARVYINGTLIASHENALYPCNQALPDILKPGEDNEIAIVLESTERKVIEMTPDMEGASLRDRAKSLNLRKNYNDFHGYLGANPYFIRMGVFRDVCLIREGNGLFDEVSLNAQVSQNMETGYLTVSARGKLDGNGRLQVMVTAPSGELSKREVQLTGVGFVVKETMEVDHPSLWYPIGYGSQPMYTVSVQLVVDGKLADSKTWNTGFRKLEMPQPLHFRINGKDVRLYGANWAPLSAVTECWDQVRVEKMLDIAIQGNYNAMRLWGSDAPVPESFYEYAEKLGLVVWQDFSNISTSGVPKDRQTNLMEAEYLMKRTMHHPCIVIWSGGNESLSFYHWANDGQKMPGREILEVELRQLCDRVDPSRPFTPQSPYGGNDHNDPRVWDTHGYTNYSFVPGYEKLNFASEDFRISGPAIKSCLRFIPEDHLWPAGYSQVHRPGDSCEVPPTLLEHCGTAESNLKFGPMWEFYDAVDAESMVHRIGIAAASFYRDTIERSRRGRASGAAGSERRCGGYLAWKFNDSWPEIYGAKIDYFLEPFIPYFFMKRAYQPVMLSFDIGNFIHVWLVNDTPTPVSGALHVKLFHITKNSLTKEVTYHVSAEAGESVDVADLTEEFQTFRRQNILFAELVDNFGHVIARTTQIVGIERAIQFPKATLQLSVSGNTLQLTTDQYAHCIYLEGNDDGDEFGWQFEDNYFTLVPGETKQMKILGSHSKGRIKARDFYSGIVTEIEYSEN